MNFLILFIILNIANVIIQTIKSIVTIKCGKTVASIVSAIAYGLYTYVVIFTAIDGLNIHVKALITAGANLVGVFVVKLIEEKKRKDRLWKVELAVLGGEKATIARDLIEQADIPMNYFWVGDWVMFNAYCENQAQSSKMAEICKVVGGKISAYESKAIF
jgi:hypothetical protein